MRSPNLLSGLGLDRASHLRIDEAALETAWQAPGARVLPVWRSQHFLTQGEPPELLFVAPRIVDAQPGERILLGSSLDAATFALDLSDTDEPARALGLSNGDHVRLGLREAAAALSREDGALLAYANGMMTWHRRHRFCGACGHETTATTAGHVRQCASPECGELHFPRTDPAVITLVHDEVRGRCLLGRQASWPEGVYSTIAGFVEPGESLEEAVAREVLEEAGITVDAVHYHSAQPWPFPSSIMLGFFARATTFDIVRHDRELEDARWFTREELREERGVKLPSKISIARRLVEDWIEGALV